MEGKDPRVDRSRASFGSQELGDYSRGYEDGVRETLREVVSMIARGHSASEVRLLAETRLDHPGPVWKGRSPAPAPPPFRRVSLDALLPSPARDGGRVSDPSLLPLSPGYSYLFLESNPSLARRFLPEVLASGIPMILITRHPEGLTQGASTGKVLILHLGALDPGPSEEPLSGIRGVEADAGAILGIVRRFKERYGPTFGCYIEALEYLKTEQDFERAIRFIYLLNSQTQASKGYLIVSADPNSLDKSELAALQKDFNFRRQAPD